MKPFDPSPANLIRISHAVVTRAPEHKRDDLASEVLTVLWGLHRAGHLDPARGERAWFYYAARIAATVSKRTDRLAWQAARDGAPLVALLGESWGEPGELGWQTLTADEGDAGALGGFDLTRALASIPQPWRGAYLDYLAGDEYTTIAARHGVSHSAVGLWVKEVRMHLQAWADAPTAADRPRWARQRRRQYRKTGRHARPHVVPGEAD